LELPVPSVHHRAMKRRSLLTSLLAAPFARPALAEGDDWPVRPVRIVCPFTAGGSQDNVARRLSVKLTEQSASPS
jgi:tripartite-type tricarboxylate transporter receptor subunit TctC